MEDVRTILSVAAILVALLSLWISRRSWLQTNRPIVTAAVETHQGGNEAIAFNLIVANTGNRPATEVRLEATETALSEGLSPMVKDKVATTIRRIFSADSEIALLLNGKAVSNSFGYTTAATETSVWIYKAHIPVVIRYKDLEGRQYVSRVNLKIKDTAGFAGTYWGNPTSNEH